MTTHTTIPNTPDPANARQGRTAQRRGNGGEARLTAQNGMYQMQGRAIIDRQNVATRGGPRSRTICGRAPVDYAGTLAGGRSVVVELKTTGKPSPSLDFGDRGVREEQVEALAARGRMGALSLLLWLNGDRLGWCTWEAVERERAGRSSIPKAAFVWLEPLEFDWLASVLAGAKA